MKDYPLVSTLMILEQHLEQAFGQDIPVIPCDLQAYGAKTSSDVQALVFLPELSSQSLAQVGHIAMNIVFHAGVAVSLTPLLLEDGKLMEARKAEAVFSLQALARDVRTSAQKRMAVA